MKLYYLDKLGWPVELVKGRWFLNFLRRLIHTRKITFKRPSCYDPQPAATITCTPSKWGRVSKPSEIDLSQKGFIPLRAFKIHDVKPLGQVTVDLQVAPAMMNPVEGHIPNALTRETIEKSEREEDIKSFDTVEELFEDLDE